MSLRITAVSGKPKAIVKAGLVAALSLAALLTCGRGWFAQEPVEVQRYSVSPAKKKWNAEELRKKYPFESVSGRLEYEARRPKGERPALPREAAERLEQAERAYSPDRRWGGNVRVESLKMLHSKEVNDFVKRDGFGVERIPRPAPSYLDLPPAPTIPFGTVSYSEGTIAGEPRVALAEKQGGPGSEARLPAVETLTRFHSVGLFSFLNPGSLGYVKDRDQVAGFQAHQFRHAPELNHFLAPPPKGREKAKERWVLRRLELVSLLKHDKPVAYVSDELPRMDKLKEARTRPLDAFEEQGLKRLQGGQDLVTEATTNRIRMLGSLRAGKQCLDCHRAERGELLGTFSYELLRDPPLRAW